jgi:hypothetical protein
MVQVVHQAPLVLQDLLELVALQHPQDPLEQQVQMVPLGHLDHLVVQEEVVLMVPMDLQELQALVEVAVPQEQQEHQELVEINI